MKRDKDYIKSSIVSKEDGYYTTKKTIIEFPKWFFDKGLYESSSDSSFVYGLFAFIVDDKYSVCRIPTVISTTPLMVHEVDRNGEVYIQLIYGPGSKIINGHTVLMQPFLSYEFFNGFFMLANVPWYFDYEDLIFALDNCTKYAGNNLGINHINNEVLVTFASRYEKDKRLFYRNHHTSKPQYVGLMDVRYSALSTLSKIAGNYPEESMVSALIYKETKPTTLENHVRK